MRKKIKDNLISLLMCFIIIVLVFSFFNIKEIIKPRLETTNNDAKSKEIVIFAVEERLPIVSCTKEKQAVYNEVIDEVFKIMNKEFAIVQCQRVRCQIMVEEGEAWGTFPYLYSKTRAENYWLSNPINSVDTSLNFYYNKERMKDKDITVNQMSDLKKYKIGGIPGSIYEEEFKKNLYNINWSSNSTALFNKLLSGEIDIALERDLVANYTIKNHFPEHIDKFDKLNLTYKPPSQETVHVLVSKNYPNSKELLDEFNEGLKIITDNGTLDRIRKKYIEAK